LLTFLKKHGHHELRMTDCLLVERGEEIPMHQRFKHKVVSSSVRRKRFSPLMLVGLSVPVVLALIASAVFILPRLASHAAVNGDCTLIVPARPLSAKGLATPYQLVATDAANGPCNEANKAQAAAHQAAPVALVPAGDPMVLNNNQPDLNKLNAYRRGVDQRAVGNLDAASTTTYCRHLLAKGPARIQLDMQLTQGQASPDPAAALLKMPDPIAVTNDGNGVAISATFNAGGNNNGEKNNTPTTSGDTTPTVGASATSPTANPNN
jgi:hypothetical protein